MTQDDDMELQDNLSEEDIRDIGGTNQDDADMTDETDRDMAA